MTVDPKDALHVDEHADASLYEISKDFAWSCSHVLLGLAPGHPCGRMHGHNYVARVTLTGPWLNEHGFLIDYHHLAPFGAWIDATLDHRHLNDVLPFQPTAELLALHLTKRLRELVDLPSTVVARISVSETPKTWATAYPRTVVLP